LHLTTTINQLFVAVGLSWETAGYQCMRSIKLWEK